MEPQTRVPKLILGNPSKSPTAAIVLFGGSSCGKSNTLLHLIVLLCGGGHRNPAIQKAFEDEFYDNKKDRYRDCDVVIHYQPKERKNIPIYVSTEGDTWKNVEDNFRFFYHCIRSRHHVYAFDGSKFVLLEQDGLLSLERPLYCVTAANFTEFGGMQAARYYLDLSCEDWWREHWIRKYYCKDPGAPVPGYTRPKHKRIREADDKLACGMLSLIDQMISKTNV